MAGPLETITLRLTRLSEPRGGREVLFLHGAWHGAWCWDGLAQAVADAGHGVNLLDLPGHGADRRELPTSTSLEDYAEYAARAAGSLDRPVLVAHSMGGWIAQKLLEEMDLPTVLLAPLPDNGRLTRTRFFGFLVRDITGLTKVLFGKPLRIKDTDLVKRLFLGDVSEDVAATHWSKLVPEPGRAARKMGLCATWAEPRPGKEPRLVIATDEDFFFPLSDERALADRLGAKFVELKGLPHNMWHDDREHQVRDLLLKFLKGLG